MNPYNLFSQDFTSEEQIETTLEEIALSKKGKHGGFFCDQFRVARTWLYKLTVPTSVFLDDDGYLHLAIESGWDFSRAGFESVSFGPEGSSVPLGYHFDELGLDWEANTFQDKGWCYVLAR